MTVDNALHLIVNGVDWEGWEEISVTRSCEAFPSSFALQVTERYPGAASKIDIKPFQSCQVKIGADLVITGYVDRYEAELAPRQHTIGIVGRGKAEDMVDCSAVINQSQINGGNALSVIQQVAAPFGVTVKSLVGPGPQIPQFPIILSETPYEIAERIARYAQMLIYDDTDGNVILAQVGATSMASGVEEGVNTQAAAVKFAGDGRYSLYKAVVMSFDKAGDIGTGGNTITNVPDATVPRYRPLIIVSEQGMNSEKLAMQRAQWEKARRIGRSQSLTVTCDSWRDSAGVLWAPNAYAQVKIPSLKLAPSKPWVIGTVTFFRSASRGSGADLTLMPPEAFQPEPNLLYAFDWQVDQAMPKNAGAAAGNRE